MRPGAVAHACNPSTLEAKAGESPEVGSSRRAWPTCWNPVFKKNYKKKNKYLRLCNLYRKEVWSAYSSAGTAQEAWHLMRPQEASSHGGQQSRSRHVTWWKRKQERDRGGGRYHIFFFKQPDTVQTQSKDSLITMRRAPVIREASTPLTQTPPTKPHLQHWGWHFHMRFGGDKYPHHISPLPS